MGAKSMFGRRFNFMKNNQSRIIAKLIAVAGAIRPVVNRVKQAKLAIQKLLGTVPEGAASYRSVCPKGAGHCVSHTMAEKNSVGRREALRRQRSFFKSHYMLKKNLAK